MQLNHLVHFREVAKQKSFSKAAVALRVSQSALSKTVKALEDQLGTKLLDRKRGGRVTITPLGQEVLSHCERVFDQLEEMKNTAAQRASEVAGPLRLAVSDNIANYLLPTRLKEFLQGNPKIIPQIFTGTATTIQQEIMQGESELGIFYTFAPDPLLNLEKLTDVEFYLVSGQPLRFDQLSRIRYVGSRIRDYAGPYPALRMLKAAGITPSQVIETNNQETQKRLTLQDYGYTLLPSFMAQAEIRNKQLFRIRTNVPLTSPVYAVSRKNRTMSRPAELMLQHLRSHARKWFSTS